MMQKLAHSLLPWWGPTSSADPCFSPDRLQHKLALLQHQCEEKQQLFQSLQSELQIYEALYGNSKKGLKGMFSLLPHPMSFLLLLSVLVKSLPWELWRSWKPILLCLRKKTSVIEDPNKKRGELSHTKPRGW